MSALLNSNGLVIKTSQQDFETTYNKLKTVISNNPNLKILLELDHQKNASTVGKELLPTRIILFGNPNLGTPLMNNAQTVAIDLPQKILVFENDNKEVKVAYNNPIYLKDRHDISEQDEILNKISQALDKITNVAILK